MSTIPQTNRISDATGSRSHQQPGRPSSIGARWPLILAFAVVYVVWGSTYLGIRFAIASIPPLLMAGTRFLVAGGILLAWSTLRQHDRPKLIHWRTAAILGLLLILCGNGAVTVAEQHITSGLAALLVASEPLWLVLLAWARPGGMAPTRVQLLGLFIGFVGVALLVAPDLSVVNGPEPAFNLIGSMLVLFGAFTWGLGSLYSTTAPAPASATTANGMLMLCGGAFQIFAGLLRGEATQLHLTRITMGSALAWFYLMGFGSLAAFSAYTYLLAHTSPAKASTYAFVNPVVAVLLGWLLAREPISTISVLAMIAIVLAVVLLTTSHNTPVTAPADMPDSLTAEPLAMSCGCSSGPDHGTQVGRPKSSA